MGIFSGIANTIKRGEIKKFLQRLNGEPNDKLAERLLMIYSTRDIRLFPSAAQEAHFRTLGMSDHTIDSESIFIYHYQKGNEVPIIDLMEKAQRAGNNGLWSSLNMHFYTNLATSYDGYERLIRDMWDKLFQGASSIQSVYQRIFPDDALPNNRDISKKAFLENPRVITPHFFLADSPITKELDARRSVTNSLGL